MRTISLVELPITNGVDIEHPEKILIKTGSYFYDIGALCYGDRSNKHRVRFKPRLVNELSLISARRAKIKQFVFDLSVLSEGLRPATVISKLTSFGRFIDWSDRCLGLDYFISDDGIENAFQAFLSTLHDKYFQGVGESTAVNSVHLFVLDMVRVFINKPDFGKDIRLLDWLPGKETTPAPYEDFARLLAISTAIFTGLSDFALNQRPFPFKLNLPSYLDWENGNHLWVFPTHLWYLPPHQWGAYRAALKYPFWAYNYKEGTINKPEDIFMLYKSGGMSDKQYNAMTAVKKAEMKIKDANANPRAIRRIRLARLALSAFAMLFIASTGANLSVVSSIEFSEEIHADVLSQNFRAVKYRANGAVVTIRVPTSLMPHLRTYIKLRRYVLGDMEFPFLFFTHSKDRVRRVTPLNEDQLSIFLRILKNMDPNFQVIRPRKIRATANDWMINNHGVSITAKVMGHSKKTEETRYGRGSYFYHLEDISEFLLKVSEFAIRQKVVRTKSDMRHFQILEAGGACENFGNPKSIDSESHSQPSCTGGCLFCANRCLVASDEDVRKITSAMFVMEQSITDPAHETLFRPMIKKCEDDLREIGRIVEDGQLIGRIRDEVFELGKLSTYWAAKYHQFLELGVLK